ncbi:MAG: DUF1294 domain-containing protein [Bacteroidales bacterium]|nr:DUF1294 domain-containing protein [Bacteroidales bacterium]
MYLKIALYYILAANMLTIIAYSIDKWKARQNHWRVREASLLLLALLGGSVGAILAMYIFRHKTQHNKFRYGVPVILLIQLSLIALMIIKWNTISMLHV